MKLRLLELLRCPNCGGEIQIRNLSPEMDSDIQEGTLWCGHGSYPVVGGIPRFVPVDNYAGSFGFQWNRFRRTQLDSYSGVPISRERFFSFTGWSPEQLKGKLVLDVGCGAGRFAEIALDCGAEVVAVDYSSAVDACRDNLGPHPRLHVLQADLYQLPLKKGSFDFIYCFGVLQHTPDVGRAFLALTGPLKEGGKLAIDVYPRLWRNLLWPKYWLRPLTRRLPPTVVFKLSRILVTLLLPLSNAIGYIPLVGSKVRYLLPVANYEGVYPLTPQQQREWALLDTFDMLAPAHDHPQSAREVRRWFEKAGLRSIQVERKGFLVGRGIK